MHVSWTDAFETQVEAVLQHIKIPSFPEKDYLIPSFGAKCGENEDARRAVQQAIDAASSEGGGRVIVPEGLWLSKGPLELKSNVNLHLAEGAILRFDPNPEYYLPTVLQRWEGVEIYNYSPFLYAWKQENIAVTGKGTIDGNAESTFGCWRPMQNRSAVHNLAPRGVPVADRIHGPDDYLRPSLIQFLHCQNLLLEDVTIYDSPFWIVHPTYCTNVTIRGLQIESLRLNNDGIDIDSCRYVLVENNRIHNGDDAIVVKSGRDQDAWRVGIPSEYIVIRRNQLRGHNALAIGSELSGGVRHVYIYENELLQVRNAIYFKSNADRGASVEYVWVRDIRVEEANWLIRFSTTYHSHRGEFHPTLFRHFIVEHVTAKQVEVAIEARGWEECPIQDVVLRHIQVDHADTATDLMHVKQFDLEHVRINGNDVSGK